MFCKILDRKLSVPHALHLYPSFGLANLKIRTHSDGDSPVCRQRFSISVRSMSLLWHNDVTRTVISNHQAFYLFDQMKAHQQTNAGVKTILISFSWRKSPGAVDPFCNVYQSATAKCFACLSHTCCQSDREKVFFRDGLYFGNRPLSLESGRVLVVPLYACAGLFIGRRCVSR